MGDWGCCWSMLGEVDVVTIIGFVWCLVGERMMRGSDVSASLL
jgi:hypothetical protein